METSWRDRLRYRVDEFFGRGTIALILGLFAVSALIIVIIAVLVVITGSAAEGPFSRLVWMGLLRTLDPGTMGGDEGDATFLGAMLTVTLGGIFVISALIGIINTGIQGRLAELRKGTFAGHRVGPHGVLGWNQQVFTILSRARRRERQPARRQRRRPRRTRQGGDGRGDPHPVGRPRAARASSAAPAAPGPDDLEIAGVQHVALDHRPRARGGRPGHRGHQDDPGDHQRPKPAAGAVPRRRRDPRPANLEAARLVGKRRGGAVVGRRVISRIIAQTCRQSGLSVVYSELLDFDGDEIYFDRQPTLEGRTLRRGQLTFEDSTLIGLPRRRRPGAAEPAPVGRRSAPRTS